MTTREEWLAGAEQRRAEPAREDRPEDVQARLTGLRSRMPRRRLAAIGRRTRRWL